MAVNFEPHVYVTMGGTSPGRSATDEIWQCGFRCRVSNGPTWPLTDDSLQDWANQLATPLSAAFTGTSSCVANVCKLTFIKVANIQADGKYPATQGPGVHTFSPALAGPNPSALPAFVGAALTLTTDVPRGRGHEGRIYWPAYGPGSTGPSTPSIMTPGVQAQLVTTAKALVNAINSTQQSDGVGNLTVGVFSSLTGGHHDVTGVKVGDVWDVQRRRKDAIREVYATSGL